MVFSPSLSFVSLFSLTSKIPSKGVGSRVLSCHIVRSQPTLGSCSSSAGHCCSSPAPLLCLFSRNCGEKTKDRHFNEITFCKQFLISKTWHFTKTFSSLGFHFLHFKGANYYPAFRRPQSCLEVVAWLSFLHFIKLLYFRIGLYLLQKCCKYDNTSKHKSDT